jgi:glycosyltransferase involved in cell wall biosynthesis
MVRRALEGSAQILQTASFESPLISVVLPTLNRAALLPGSIESVLNQTERNLELIVVDDGSSDSTGEIIARYAQHDSRITWVRQQNLGLPRGLNNGFRLARGEFFTWTSDDNRYFPDACSIMSGALLANPEVGFVFADMLRRRTAGLIYHPNPKPEKLWEYNKFGGAFMYRRTIAELVGEYDPDMAMVEDYDYFLRLSQRADVRHLPYIMYEYREHEDSLTNRQREGQARAFEKLLRKHRKAGRARRWELSSMAVSASGAYRRTGLLRDALRLARTAWCLWPFNWRSYRSIALVLASSCRRIRR